MGTFFQKFALAAVQFKYLLRLRRDAVGFSLAGRIFKLPLRVSLFLRHTSHFDFSPNLGPRGTYIRT